MNVNLSAKSPKGDSPDATGDSTPVSQTEDAIFQPNLPAQPLKIIPKVTSLHQNYPNPFNPETWFPFQLAEESDVTILIYNLKGEVVRTLALGDKEPGFYISRDSAAYWDGRNDAGESITSGVYFYLFQADDFATMRKMVVVK